jgi:CheY-like chemotaxis protein
MRIKRAVLVDDEPLLIDALSMYFEERGYEILAFQEPVICPVYYGPHDCKQQYACADIMLIDYHMKGMNGLTILREQTSRGCRLIPRNKAIMSGRIDDDITQTMDRFGIAFFQKPLDFKKLSSWVADCETRVDLSVRLSVRRREPRSAVRTEVTYQAPTYYAPASGLAVNLSSSGMCLLLSSPIPREQRVRLHSKLLGASQTALVRWIRELDKGQYMAGLQYVQ